MKSVCVFCGSSPGASPRFGEAARGLGQQLAQNGLHLVFGGARVGLMGALADAALASGGAVTGVITKSLADAGVAHRHVTDLRVVDDMHERKALMAELADGFIALPGGIGTLEELLEILTWGQLGLHRKPCGVLEVAGFFGPLLGLLDHLVPERFLRQEHRDMLLVESEPALLLERMRDYQPQAVAKWLS